MATRLLATHCNVAICDAEHSRRLNPTEATSEPYLLSAFDRGESGKHLNKRTELQFGQVIICENFSVVEGLQTHAKSSTSLSY